MADERPPLSQFDKRPPLASFQKPPLASFHTLETTSQQTDPKGRELLPSGALPSGTELLTTPQGRHNIWSAIKQEPGRIYEGIKETIKAPGEILKSDKPVTTGEMIAPATNIGLLVGMRPSEVPFARVGKNVTVTPTGEAAPAEASMLRKIFSPGSVTPKGEEAAGMLREAGGTAARDTETTRAALGQYEAQINAMPPQQQLDLLGYMEGRSTGAKIPDPKLQAFADEFRDAMKLREQKIASSSRLSQAGILEDYVTHYWKDPAAARVFVNRWTSKQGSGATLKKRSIPTIEEGIRAGLVPLTNNPLEIAMRYVTNMDRYIGMNEMIEAGRNAGSVKFFKPGSRNIPEGWVELQGHLAKRQPPKGPPLTAHAPAEWATIWNRHVDPGVYRSQLGGQAYDALRNTSNLTTQAVLGLSGYHVMAMANEAVISSFAKGLSQAIGGAKLAGRGALRRDVAEILRGGQIAAKGAGAIPASLVSPVSRALQGRKFQQVYLGRTPGSPDYRHLVDLFEKAGGRAVGKRHAVDYQFSSAGSYFTSWKRGSLKMEMRNALSDIKASKFPVGKAALTVGRSIGRAFETISDPLFSKYIPMLKSGVFYDTMKAWLEANPGATYDQQMVVARKLIDSIDNRFGEMIQDNIMWSTLAKQTAAIGMLSYSWNLGTVREIMGGVAAAGRTLGKGIDIASPKYDPRVAYVIAFPMAVATMNGIYQYLKTGKPPQTAQDLMAPQTSGEAPGFGGRGMVPERAILPGYQKDVFGWYTNLTPMGHGSVGAEILNKMNPLMRMGFEFMNKKDWRDDPIIRPDPTVPEWLSDYFNFAVNSVTPISVGRIGKGEKKGSAFGTGEELLGIRPAPSMLTDPEGFQRGMTAMEKKKWMLKQAHDRAQARQYGGPQE
jgi:hypothetical protein